MRVRATAVCYVGMALRQPGDEFEYDGQMPDPHLEAIGDQSKAAPPAESEDEMPPRTKRTGKKRSDSEG